MQLGDSNNSFFHASIKEKKKHKGLRSMITIEGTKITTPEEIEDEILLFYSKLVGTKLDRLEGIDIPAIKNGKILTRDSAQKLIRPMDEKEVWDALASIGNNKSPCTDGFNAYLFQKCLENHRKRYDYSCQRILLEEIHLQSLQLCSSDSNP